MRHLTDISGDGWSFVSDRMSKWWRPPVFWQLEPPREDMMRLEAGQVRRRSDSYTLEIDFPPEGGYAVEDDNGGLIREFEGMMRRYAEVEDERDFHATDEPLAAGVSFELESSVPSGSGEMLEVIGPGGRATAFHGVRGTTRADITIRRRARALLGIWRHNSDILRPLEQALGDDFMAGRRTPTLRAAFGYFELSKYELQSLMRPVFLFVIEQEQDPEGRWPGFQRIVVSPATTMPSEFGFRSVEGLGIWVESAWCSGMSF